MTARYIQAPAKAAPQRTLASAAAEAARRVPGVAYLSPGPRGGDVRRVRRHDATAGVSVTAYAAGWHVRIHLAVFAGHRAATVADDVRHALVAELVPLAAEVTAQAARLPPSPPPPPPQVTVGVVVTAVLTPPMTE